MSLEYPFDLKKSESELNDNILKGIKNKKILNEKGNYYNDIILDNYSKDFLDIIDEMMTLEPKQRPDIETILKKDIVIKRMKSLLEESKFNEKIADSQINKYQENEQKILKSIQERLNEQKKQFDEKGDLLVIEDLIKGEDIPSEKKIDEFISKTQNKKIQYNYLRQMSLIQEILKRNNTIPNL